MTHRVPSPDGTVSTGGLKAVLHHYLLGVLKHVASVETGYLTDCMGRPSGIPMPWFEEGAAPNADMYATAEESVADVFAFADRCAAASDAAIEAGALTDFGSVPWWGEAPVTLGRLLVHVLDEHARHLGQVDVLRETLDGAVGASATTSNLPGPADGVDADWWAGYRARLAAIAGAAPDTVPVCPGQTDQG